MAEHVRRPWLVRTYSGYGSAQLSNELYRRNLARGQKGLSVALDLPTQRGYDSDHPRSRGEVGRTGVPVDGIWDMDTLFEGIPIYEMNTSMTINAPAPMLLGMLIAAEERQALATGRKANVRGLSATVQNDLFKERLSRHLEIFPLDAAMTLSAHLIAEAQAMCPSVNATNICPYHLAEAGGNAVQKTAYAFANAIDIMERVRKILPPSEVAERLPEIFGRISFFTDFRLRIIEEIAIRRVSNEMWSEIGVEFFGVTNPELRRWRTGAQVSSVFLPGARPLNNIFRIGLEAFGIVASELGATRALQLPGYNEPHALPTEAEQAIALDTQHIIIEETDLLEYGDIFKGSVVMDALVRRLWREVDDELTEVLEMGGACKAALSGYIQRELDQSMRDELAKPRVGVSDDAAPAPAGEQLIPDPALEAEQVARLQAERKKRNSSELMSAGLQLREAFKAGGKGILQASIRAAHAGLTVGEWADIGREELGTYEAERARISVTTGYNVPDDVAELRPRVAESATKLGRQPRIAVGVPGLDGHSNAATQIAIAAADAGFDVDILGDNCPVEKFVSAVRDGDPHLLVVSVHSGAHNTLVPDILEALIAAGCGEVPVAVGGHMPDEDVASLLDEHGAQVKFATNNRHITMAQIVSRLLEIIETTAR